VRWSDFERGGHLDAMKALGIGEVRRVPPGCHGEDPLVGRARLPMVDSSGRSPIE
jgi:hypothetical protein